MDVNGMQLVDLGGSTLEYYGDYEFGNKPAMWRKIVQNITTEKIALTRCYTISAKTFIEPWNNTVVLELSREENSSSWKTAGFFNQNLIQSPDFKEAPDGSMHGRFWVRYTDIAPISLTEFRAFYFSTLAFEYRGKQYLIVNWNESAEESESLRRESTKIFQSLQIKTDSEMEP